jgi:hypothetical protein
MSAEVTATPPNEPMSQETFDYLWNTLENVTDNGYVCSLFSYLNFMHINSFVTLLHSFDLFGYIKKYRKKFKKGIHLKRVNFWLIIIADLELNFNSLVRFVSL